MLDRLPTWDNLFKIKVDIESTLCPVCRMDKESMQHLLFDCINDVEVWRFVEKWWSLSLPINKSLDSMLAGFKETSNNSVVRKVLEDVF